MLKHLTILCLFIALATQSKAQVNLVYNGDFEEHSECPEEEGLIYNAFGWSCPNFFMFNPPNSGSLAEYFNECSENPYFTIPNNFGGDSAQSGSAYVGFYGICNTDIPVLKCKEYLQGELITNLKTNTYYCFEMYLSLADFSNQAIDDISVYFSNILVNDSGSLDLSGYQPQITNLQGQYFSDNTNWARYTGYFKAAGGENRFIIGGFLALNDTPTIGSSGDVNCAYYFVDNVQLYECGDSLNNSIDQTQQFPISIYPNPAAENVTITLPPNTNKAELLIYTVQGQLLSQTQLSNIQTINTSSLANGLYLFVIQSNGSIVGREKVIITH